MKGLWNNPKLFLFLLYLIGSNNAYCQSKGLALDSIRQQFEREMAQMRADFEVYEAQVRADYNRYVNSIKNIWGGDTIVDNTKKVWVEYGKDYRSRSVVDFENGDIGVEVAVEEADKLDDASINNRLVEAVRQMLDSRGSSSLYQATDGKSQPILDRPALEGLVDLSIYNMDDSLNDVKTATASQKRSTPPMPTVKGKDLNVKQRSGTAQKQEKPSEKKSFAQKRKEKHQKKLAEMQVAKVVDNAAIAQKIVEQSKKIVTTTKGADGKQRQVVKVEMALVSDRISKSAALYKDLIAEFSGKYQIEQPLIYAIIETESAFQPKAVSPANAYGLMQLVPTSGGREAYRYVYGQDKIPQADELFNPRFNIQLGTAYLRWLTNALNSVSNEDCRRLCVIASYNTGTGNLGVAFIGTTNIGQAYPYINALDYNQLYNHLVTNLPYSETRNYVAKVTQRREKYMKQ